MAGYCTGPEPRVPRDVFVLTYIAALDAGQRPGVVIRRRFGISVDRYERQRAMLAHHGWLPTGRVGRADVPVLRMVLRAKLRQVQDDVVAREDRAAARERRAQVRALHERARAVAAPPSTAVLDHFGG